jgi:hypothetical protein
MAVFPLFLSQELWRDPLPLYRVSQVFNFEAVHADMAEGSIIYQHSSYQYGSRLFFSNPKTDQLTAIDTSKVEMLLKAGWLEPIPAMRADPEEKPLTRTRFQRILADVDDLP